MSFRVPPSGGNVSETAAIAGIPSESQSLKTCFQFLRKALGDCAKLQPCTPEQTIRPSCVARSKSMQVPAPPFSFHEKRPMVDHRCRVFGERVSSSRGSVSPAARFSLEVYYNGPVSTNWMQVGFDDRSWPSGPAQLGYGDGDETTVLIDDPGYEPPATYYRHIFTNSLTVFNLTLRLVADDGAVIYLNGVELFRQNMPAGPVSFSTLALINIETNENHFIQRGLADPNLNRVQISWRSKFTRLRQEDTTPASISSWSPGFPTNHRSSRFLLRPTAPCLTRLILLLRLRQATLMAT